MDKKNNVLGWGQRYRRLAKANGFSLAKIAETLGVAESTVRSWTNANRNIKLHLFFKLCDAAQLDPAVVLFAGKVDERFLAIGAAWGQANDSERESFTLLAEAVLARHGSAGEAGRAP